MTDGWTKSSLKRNEQQGEAVEKARCDLIDFFDGFTSIASCHRLRSVNDRANNLSQMSCREPRGAVALMATLFVLAEAVNIPDCSAPRDLGDSCDTHASTSFYFDARTKVCQPFAYRGCGGNANRFSTAQECRAACVNRAKTVTSSAISANANVPAFVPVGKSHDQWRKADLCGGNYLVPNGKYILCSDGCPKNHNCVSDVCCPTKDYVCSLRDDNGTFEDGIEDRPRFAWNHDVKSCVRYSYYGANGNYNNFPNFQSCIKFCSSAQKLVS
ncbi:unnamed protein product [Caenorhabditis auriculariae]|uniref:BPTI/Kunitz inhibitor domain-containing protein n=1 Tax=Caenorhabditis auriculariae TaxID=2777116 RepID=A0A8S1HII7_9PELO|nr:unnamed protein product [Caenorhabditis auriculariae]